MNAETVNTVLGALIDRVRAEPPSDDEWPSPAPGIARAADVLLVFFGKPVLAFGRSGEVFRLEWTAADGVKARVPETDAQVIAWAWQVAAQAYPELAPLVSPAHKAVTGDSCRWCEGRGHGGPPGVETPERCPACGGARWLPRMSRLGT